MENHLQQAIDILFRRQGDADLVEILIADNAFEDVLLMGFTLRDAAIDHHGADIVHQALVDPQPAPVGELLLELFVAVAMLRKPLSEPFIGV